MYIQSLLITMEYNMKFCEKKNKKLYQCIDNFIDYKFLKFHGFILDMN